MTAPDRAVIPRFSPRGRSMSRILLDDDASLLKLMSMRLRSQGYEVDTRRQREGAPGRTAPATGRQPGAGDLRVGAWTGWR